MIEAAISRICWSFNRTLFCHIFKCCAEYCSCYIVYVACTWANTQSKCLPTCACVTISTVLSSGVSNEADDEICPAVCRCNVATSTGEIATLAMTGTYLTIKLWQNVVQILTSFEPCTTLLRTCLHCSVCVKAVQSVRLVFIHQWLSSAKNVQNKLLSNVSRMRS